MEGKVELPPKQFLPLFCRVSPDSATILPFCCCCCWSGRSGRSDAADVSADAAKDDEEDAPALGQPEKRRNGGDEDTAS